MVFLEYMLTLALLRAIGSSATTITLCHSKIRDSKWYSPFNFIQKSETPNDTALSTFLWELKKSKKKKQTNKLTWSVLKVVLGYLNVCKWCLLCVNEKLLLTTNPDQRQLLNKRSKLIAKCRHQNKFQSNYKANDKFVDCF